VQIYTIPETVPTDKITGMNYTHTYPPLGTI